MSGDVIEGYERGEVEYALTKPEWEARPPLTPSGARHSIP
jgi:hypothetical protein